VNHDEWLFCAGSVATVLTWGLGRLAGRLWQRRCAREDAGVEAGIKLLFDMQDSGGKGFALGDLSDPKNVERLLREHPPKGPSHTPMNDHRCDKILDAGTRRCNVTATLFYQSETIRQVAARCGEHEVIPYKPELGRLLILTADEYDRECTRRDGAVLTPVEILRQAADMLERTGFSPLACAVGRGGELLEDVSIEATRFCVSGAARAVAFRGIDGDGTPQEKAYLEAMDAFCRFVGTKTVMEWAGAPGRSTEDACAGLRGAARSLT
jgi:hypothetical protein